MDMLLSGLQWKVCLIYLDDILVFAPTFDEMIFRLNEILTRFNNGGMKLRLNKCKFCATEVSYLGHVISASGIQPDPAKISAIENMQPPTKIKGVKSFLGLISYYRKFIPNCAKICQPLNRLLKKDVKFTWGPLEQSTFVKLKSLIMHPPILNHPDFSLPFILQTDASHDGIGAVLSQIDSNNQEHPVAFASRTLKPAERNYPITELETLCGRICEVFRPYLYQHDVTVETDHTAVKAVLEKSNVSPRIARLGLALAGINMTVLPRRGTKHQNADTLSRLPDNKSKQCFDIEEDNFYRPPLAVQAVIEAFDFSESQNNDQHLKDIIDHLKRNIPITNYIFERSQLYFIDNGLQKLVIHKSLQQLIIQTHHNDSFGGHFGFQKTVGFISRKYYWSTLKKDVKLYCTNCSQCQINKTSRHKFKASLFPIPVSGPFERLAVDCVGPLPLTILGNRFIIVFIDHFSKYIEAFATADITANTVARLFVENIGCNHGAPQILQSDRGTDFTSCLMSEVVKIFETKNVFTTAYHPIANGTVERANQTLITRIRM